MWIEHMFLGPNFLYKIVLLLLSTKHKVYCFQQLIHFSMTSSLHMVIPIQLLAFNIT